ncbi:hypothetical protein ACWDSL_36040, partial [Streptomyces sp. NPDC000941]
SDGDSYSAACSTSTTPRHPNDFSIHKKHPAQQPDRDIDTLQVFASIPIYPASATGPMCSLG